METERHELTLKDKNNRQVEIYKAYAQYLHEYISSEYESEEARVREELSKAVDEIFRSIYNGGFSLSLDDKYNVQVSVNDHEGYTDDIETSTAQSISIIFAFIAGVIKMARESQNPENGFKAEDGIRVNGTPSLILWSGDSRPIMRSVRFHRTIRFF